MLRFIRRGLVALLPAALLVLVFGALPATPQVGVQNVNLSCSDGTNLNLALDPTSLLGLTNAVSAIGLFPAGNPALACGLNQQSDPSGANGPKDFAVGGGRTSLPGESFALSAHALSDATPTVPQ